MRCAGVRVILAANSFVLKEGKRTAPFIREISPLDDDGNTGGSAFVVGDIPNIQRMTQQRTNEG
jgi:hypothetical protein